MPGPAHMNIPMFKRILDFIGVILGAVGITLCLAVIVAAWWYNSPITYSLLYRVFPRVEFALTVGDQVVDEFSAFVDEAQSTFVEVTDSIPIVTALDNEIQQATVYANVAKYLTDSVEQGANEFFSTGQSDGNRWLVSLSAGRLSSTLSEATSALASVAGFTQQVQEKRTETIDELDRQVDQLQVQVAAVDVAIVQTQSDVAVIKSKVPLWIDQASLLVTLLFIWFGAAQYFMLRACWLAIYPNKTEQDETSDTMVVFYERSDSDRGDRLVFRSDSDRVIGYGKFPAMELQRSRLVDFKAVMKESETG